jgi:hypothetical protein
MTLGCGISHKHAKYTKHGKHTEFLEYKDYKDIIILPKHANSSTEYTLLTNEVTN